MISFERVARGFLGKMFCILNANKILILQYLCYKILILSYEKREEKELSSCNVFWIKLLFAWDPFKYYTLCLNLPYLPNKNGYIACIAVSSCIHIIVLLFRITCIILDHGHDRYLVIFTMRNENRVGPGGKFK